MPASPLLDDLKDAMWRHVMRELPTDRTGTMRERDLNSLLTIYATWRDRMPVARPRRVHLSSTLLANPHRLDYGGGFGDLLSELIDGNDIRRRLSTGIGSAYTLGVHPYLSRRGGVGGRHLDRLLADWGIHHIHLWSTPHPKLHGFTRRSRYVLLALFRPHDVYLIDVIDHESNGANWSALGILETVVRSWPEAELLWSPGILTGLKGGNWSDKDRRLLRNAGVSGGAVEIDGQVYLAGGQTAGGHPMHVTQHVMKVGWFLAGYEPTDAQLREELSAVAASRGLRDEWRGAMWGDEYGFARGREHFHAYGNLLPYA